MKQYILNAFTDQAFSGNPAAVCILDQKLDDQTLLNIAKQNNLSETAFILETNGNYHLRWFTPTEEIDLCGHATLASAHSMMTYLHPELESISFKTLSGTLDVKKIEKGYQMSFPSYKLKKLAVTDEMEKAIGARVVEAYLGRDLVLVLDNSDAVKELQVKQDKIAQLDGLLVHVTAQDQRYDCVSRSFGPKIGIAEDPVFGSGHCHIIPYWANVTGKTDFLAYQASERGGILYCHYEGNLTKLAGEVKLFSVGDIFIN